MRIAVTGASGFIGSHLVRKLKEERHEVAVISREKGIDITKWSSVKGLEPCKVIVHLAAKTFVPNSFKNPMDFYKTNYLATLNALELARKWKARMIFLSSYFYGCPQYIPVDEKHPLNPHNPYAQSKMQSEQLCEAYARDFNVPSIAFRLFNVYGPGQNGSFLIPEILDKIKKNEVITLNDPRPKRDFIHIDDVLRAIIKGLDYNSTSFEVFNLGTGNSTDVEKLVALIQRYSPKYFEIVFKNEYREGEILCSEANIQKAKRMLNWHPKISLEQGIKSFFEQ
ncbi:MAG: GDP-mannose 4,6-dehydratase [Balneolaceae bacterium]|nr:GDP-mannose 4,6-dehydratase [Balneolaceae bacterium]